MKARGVGEWTSFVYPLRLRKGITNYSLLIPAPQYIFVGVSSNGTFGKKDS